MTPPRPVIEVRLIDQDGPCPVSEAARLKRLLKALLRQYGFRAVSVREIAPRPPGPAETILAQATGTPNGVPADPEGSNPCNTD